MKRKWEEKINFQITEQMSNLIYVNDLNVTNETTEQNFQYNITHRIIACNYNLKIWKIKTNDECDFRLDSDTIEGTVPDRYL